MEIGDSAIIKWNYELHIKVVNKSNIQSQTPSIVTHTRHSTMESMSNYINKREAVVEKNIENVTCLGYLETY
jgi:hypothetical protein